MLDLVQHDDNVVYNTPYMLHLNQFDYHLPKSLIAQSPASPRGQSRLMIINRKTEMIEHAIFADLPSILSSHDLLVRNNSKVFPARLLGQKPTGGKVELLLIKSIDDKQQTWECLTKPGLKTNQTVSFPNSQLTATCVGDSTGDTRHMRFSLSSQTLLDEIQKIGRTPLPPYIHSQTSEPRLRQEYQTHYAHDPGSVAAPTAGLHFTPIIDQQLQDRGVSIASVTLHVSLGTFQGVKTDNITDHQMHSEWFSINQQVAETINHAKQNNQRVIAVGTTACRVLESCVDSTGKLRPQSGETDIFIYPPHQFQMVDALLTNFHLPKSTLLMLVSAFVSHPNTNHNFTSFSETLIGKAYQIAIQQKYRFFSFGDAMLIV